MTLYVLWRTAFLWLGSTPHKDLRTASDCSSEPETTLQTSQMAAAQQVVPVFNLSFPPSIQLPKLDGTNWQQWSATLGALMRMNGTHCHLTHAAPVAQHKAQHTGDVSHLCSKEKTLGVEDLCVCTSEDERRGCVFTTLPIGGFIYSMTHPCPFT